MFDEPRAEFEHQPVAGWVHLQHFAVRRVGPDIRLGLVGDVEDELAVAIEPHRPLTPLSAHAHELAHWQGVEKFVADHDRRPVWDFLEALRPRDRHAAVNEQFVLHRRHRWARLDEPHVERIAKSRHNAGGAQRIAHQRAAPRSELDEAHWIGRAHARPHFRRPKPDQFAEHLRNLRRGREIARRAEGIAVHVVAEIGMGERELHVLLDGDRATLRDHRPDFIEELRHDDSPRRPRLHASTPRPATMSGSERTIPIVSPRPRSSRRGSGSRKNSLKMRAAP